ncbi:MAG: hypothetical protein ACRDL3_05635 [Solirubrobacterales bacterium]
MLFDLRGKRRRFIQVVYALLAALFLIGFVGFGVGSESGAGGIFDALGVGGGDDGSSNPQYEEQIESAEQQVAQNPKDERALVELARVHFLAGQSELEADEQTGAPVVTDEARVELDESVKAWERYLKLEPKNPDANAAGLVVQGYVFLNDAEGASETQRIVTDARPSQGAYSNLAFYLYAAGDIEGGDEAADRAVAEAEGAQKASTRKQLAGIRKSAIKQEEKLKKASKQAEDAPPGANPLQTPLGGGAPAPAPAP